MSRLTCAPSLPWDSALRQSVSYIPRTKTLLHRRLHAEASSSSGEPETYRLFSNPWLNETLLISATACFSSRTPPSKILPRLFSGPGSHLSRRRSAVSSGAVMSSNGLSGFWGSQPRWDPFAPPEPEPEPVARWCRDSEPFAEWAAQLVEMVVNDDYLTPEKLTCAKGEL